MKLDIEEFSVKTRLAYSDMFYALGHLVSPESNALTAAREMYFAVADLLKYGYKKKEFADTHILIHGKDGKPRHPRRFLEEKAIDKSELNKELCSFERILCDTLHLSLKPPRDLILQIRSKCAYNLASAMRKKLLKRNH